MVHGNAGEEVILMRRIEGQAWRYIFGLTALVSLLLMVGGAILAILGKGGGWPLRCAVIGGISLVVVMVVAR